MGNPLGIALFSFMGTAISGDSKLRVLILAGVVSAIITFGSIGVVRYANRDRQLTPAIAAASQSVLEIPDSLISGTPDPAGFIARREEFARQLMEGALPVDSVRAFYQSYALWMRDGRWDPDDVIGLAGFLNNPTTR
jgi:hypothetical protein